MDAREEAEMSWMLLLGIVCVAASGVLLWRALAPRSISRRLGAWGVPGEASLEQLSERELRLFDNFLSRTRTQATIALVVAFVGFFCLIVEGYLWAVVCTVVLFAVANLAFSVLSQRNELVLRSRRS